MRTKERRKEGDATKFSSQLSLGESKKKNRKIWKSLRGSMELELEEKEKEKEEVWGYEDEKTKCSCR